MEEQGRITEDSEIRREVFQRGCDGFVSIRQSVISKMRECARGHEKLDDGRTATEDRRRAEGAALQQGGEQGACEPG
jgi:hypothetical protein